MANFCVRFFVMLTAFSFVSNSFVVYPSASTNKKWDNRAVECVKKNLSPLDYVHLD